MLREAGRSPRELNRLDIKNYHALAPETEDLVLRGLDRAWPRLDSLVVLDQVGAPAYGVVTERVIDRLAELGETTPNKVILADSRERIASFRSVWLKANQAECIRGIRAVLPGPNSVDQCVADLARRVGRPVFCTCGENGIVVADPRNNGVPPTAVPAHRVAGPIDTVGAGDAASAAIACALTADVGLTHAAAFANLVASVTIQQIGTTGTATPEQIRERWREVRS
jgi:bifunctional ADP-heptose synthase (sugar kinase/adenylyltransferase)